MKAEQEPYENGSSIESDAEGVEQKFTFKLFVPFRDGILANMHPGLRSFHSLTLGFNVCHLRRRVRAGFVAFGDAFAAALLPSATLADRLCRRQLLWRASGWQSLMLGLPTQFVDCGSDGGGVFVFWR